MEKKLTAEEAIEHLDDVLSDADLFCTLEEIEALKMAIEALQSKPKQGGLTADEIKEYAQMIYLGRQSICKESCNCHIECNKAEELSDKFETVIEALQSQPPTVTDEKINIPIIDLRKISQEDLILAEKFSIQYHYPDSAAKGIKDGDFYIGAIEMTMKIFLAGYYAMRNKLTPNK
jgi:hypothetical protein